MQGLSILLLSTLCYSSVKARTGNQSEIMRIQLSPTTPTHNSSDLSLPSRDCGFIFCDGSDVALDDTTNYWDYYVDWEIPIAVTDESKVFVLGNRFQMPRSYLVFRDFAAKFAGEYRCVLHFRRRPVASHTLNISLGDGVATKDCIGNSP